MERLSPALHASVRRALRQAWELDDVPAHALCGRRDNCVRHYSNSHANTASVTSAELRL
jgi:hypothetical protein